jgi:hypothetical protein
VVEDAVDVWLDVWRGRLDHSGHRPLPPMPVFLELVFLLQPQTQPLQIRTLLALPLRHLCCLVARSAL